MVLLKNKSNYIAGNWILMGLEKEFRVYDWLTEDPQFRAARTNLESERLLWSRAMPWLLWMWHVNLRFPFLCTALQCHVSPFCALSGCKHFAPGSKEKSLAGILDTNCFKTDSSADVRVLCPTLARFNHSCLPNCPSAACEDKCCFSQLTPADRLWFLDGQEHHEMCSRCSWPFNSSNSERSSGRLGPIVAELLCFKDSRESEGWFTCSFMPI